MKTNMNNENAISATLNIKKSVEIQIFGGTEGFTKTFRTKITLNGH